MKSKRTFLFFTMIVLLAMCISPLFAQLKEFKISQAESQTQPVFADYPDEAAIIIFSPITGISFSSNMGLVKQIDQPDQSKYILIVRTLKQKIFINKQEFERGVLDIPSIKKREVKWYRVEIREDGILEVDSDPRDAQVFINGKQFGATPYKGTFKQDTYEVVLKKDMYHDLIQKVEVKSDTTHSFSFLLNPKFGSLTITSDPNGAEVYLDNSKIGVAPVSKNKIPSGEHQLLVRLKYYQDTRKTIVIKDGQETKDNIIMKDTEASLILKNQKKWASRRNWTLVGTGLCAAAGLGLKFLSDSKFDEYEKASSTKDATDLRSQVENYDMYTIIAFAATGVFAGWATYNHFKIPNTKISISMNDNAGKVVATINF